MRPSWGDRPRVAIENAVLKVNLYLCAEHARRVLALIPYARHAGQHDRDCEACASGLSTRAFCGRLARDVMSPPVTEDLTEVLLLRQGRELSMGIGPLLRAFDASRFSKMRLPLRERVRMFISAPTDNGGLDSGINEEMLAALVERFSTAG